jgi:HprK-related kinase B
MLFSNCKLLNPALNETEKRQIQQALQPLDEAIADFRRPENNRLPPKRYKLALTLPDFRLHLNTDSAELKAELLDYFTCHMHEITGTEQADVKADAEVDAFEMDTQFVANLPWQDWTREGGKVGRKDTYFDFECTDGQKRRLVYKIKTGMLLLQSRQRSAVMGPVHQYPNQVINFLLTQYLNRQQQQGWLLAHAAGLQIQQHGIAIAGLSGGGKSTLMLKLLEHGEHFISNDRLLLKRLNAQKTWMHGIPKQPRINPGTIVHHDRLHPLINEAERQHFLSLPSETLRQIEQKYDAPVDSLFWQGCTKLESQLDYLIILNWGDAKAKQTKFQQVDLKQREDLLPAIMKSAGVFYSVEENGEESFPENAKIPSPADYLTALEPVKVYELSGKRDFEQAVESVLSELRTD